MPRMTDGEFLEILVRRHDGEVSGEGVFAGLVETCTDEPRSKTPSAASRARSSAGAWARYRGSR